MPESPTPTADLDSDAPLSRTQRFLAYVAQPGYPCAIGRQMAVAGQMDHVVTELCPDDTPEVRDEKVRAAVTAFLRDRLHVVLYPGDPLDFPGLLAMHREVHPHVFSEVAIRDLERARDAREVEFPLAPRPRSTADFVAGLDEMARRRMAPTGPAVDLMRSLSVRVPADVRSATPEIRAAVEHILSIEPNVMPGYGNDSMQSIVVSPHYPGARGEGTDVRTTHERGDHGRRCEVTGLVMTHFSDILAALRTQPGMESRDWLDQSQHPYNAMHVLVGHQRRIVSVALPVGLGIPTLLPEMTLPDRSVAPQVPRVGRNQQCPCGSGKKYKVCHGRNQQS